jgi:hypothetical protein
MHTEIVFLRKDESLDEACRHVENYLLEEIYTVFWDGFEASKELSGSLKDMRESLAKRCNDYNTDAEIDRYLAEAKDLMEKSDRYGAGYKYRYCGYLLEQMLCADTVVYNMDDSDYSIPATEGENGWFAVVVDFHY